MNKSTSNSKDIFGISELKDKIKRTDDEFSWCPTNPDENTRTYESERLSIQKELKTYEKWEKVPKCQESLIKKVLEVLLRKSMISNKDEPNFRMCVSWKFIIKWKLLIGSIGRSWRKGRRRWARWRFSGTSWKMRDWILLESLGRIKQGEFQRGNNSGIQVANEILVDGKIPFYDLNFMKGKIGDDAKRLYKMKVNWYWQQSYCWNHLRLIPNLQDWWMKRSS